MGELLDSLIGWSIERRVLVLLGALTLMIAGALAVPHAAIEVLPDFMPPRVVVQTEAPGLDSLDVEELVTRPIERALLGTPSTTSVRSTSSPGLSVITLLFDEEVEVYRARQLVTERVDLARAHLPATVKPPQLAPITAPIAAMLKFCMTSAAPDTQQAIRDLRTFATWTLRPRLLGLPGVSQVTVHGGEVERIEVRPDPVRMQARGVALADLTAAILNSQSLSGAGFLETGGARLDVRSEARLSLPGGAEALGAVPLALPALSGRLPVRLGEVAEIVHASEPLVGAALYDGHPAVCVQVNKLPWADTLTVTRHVEAALQEIARALPNQARIEPPVFRQASFVTTALHSVGRAMALGSLLVIVILIVFLRSGRLAVISLTAIPLSLFGAALVLLASGASLNAMTLGGLAIAVGEVVDDAIVDVENVWRRLRENARSQAPHPALTVIREASKEVRGSVVYATVIVCLVLVPVLRLGGIAGRIFSPLAQAYILAIGASLVVALTVTPALCAWLLPRWATAEAHATPLAEFLLSRYRRLARRVVAHPRVVLGTAGGLATLAMVALPWLGGGFLPDFQEGSVIANLNAVPGTSLPETLRLTERVDAQLRPARAVHVAARVGRAELDEDAFPVHRVEMDVVLKPDGGDAEEQSARIAQGIGQVAGLAFSVEGFLTEHIHDLLAGEAAPVVVQVIGPDLPTLRRLAADVGKRMSGISGLGAVRIEAQFDVPQVRVTPKRDALSRWGVQPLELAEQVTAWRQGRTLTQILEPSGRVIDVAMAGAEALRTREALPNLPIWTNLPSGSSGMVPLSALATIDEAAAPVLIHHLGGERRITVGASAPGSALSGSVSRLRDALKGLSLPHGYHVEIGGEAVVRTQAALRLLLLGALILIGIYVLLATAFGALRDAAIVLVNLPLGLIGGVGAALLLPEGLSVAGFVGFVTLFGIIARNGILLVAHKRHLDAAHPEMMPTERVLQAAEERLLPILMTAATAGLGLLPLALSIGAAGSELEAPMALIVCGGLVSSTALNMLVLPTLYVWLATRDSSANGPK